MQSEAIKQEMFRFIKTLPDNATWDDIMEKIYVRQAIEEGLKDSDTGKVVDVDTIRKRFGLTE